jgi:hypothetical protein
MSSASNGVLIMNVKYVNTEREAVVTYFEVGSHNFPIWTESNRSASRKSSPRPLEHELGLSTPKHSWPRPPLNFLLWRYMKRNETQDTAARDQTPHCCGWYRKCLGFKNSTRTTDILSKRTLLLQFFKQMLGQDLKISRNRLLSQPSQFNVHNHPRHSLLYGA